MSTYLELADSSTAMLFGYFWMQISGHSSMWTRWVHAYHIRGASIWDIYILLYVRGIGVTFWELGSSLESLF
mgnify:CR=1 FL=1